MAPVLDRKTLAYARRAALTAGITHQLVRRGLTVDSTQKITLGIIAVYVVVIALLWNIPYVRNVLWPFKVSPFT
jgi:hypothetical protein